MWNLGSWNIFSCISDSSVNCSSSTMKQKIEMKVQYGCEKRKSEALMVAAGFRGVISVEAGEDKLIVIGVGIDSVCLTRALRKKLSYAVIMSVEEVKEEEKKKKPEEEKKPDVMIPIQWPGWVYHQYPYC